MKYVGSKNKKTSSESRSQSKASVWINRGLTLVFVALFIVSGVKLTSAFLSYGESKNAYNSLEQYAVVDSIPVVNEGGDEEKPVYVDPYDYLREIGADFDALKAINPDVVAWINIPGTKLNYPVTQGNDNSYYLRHLFNGKYNIGGCVFLDARNSSDFSDRHSILYGHRMDDGSMFTSIQNYKNQSYFDAHPYALLITPNGNYVIEFFAGYVTDVGDDAWKLSFSSDLSFEGWLAKVTEKSDFKGMVAPTPSDCILTLSTCSHVFNNARYVLHGVIRSESAG